MAKENKKDKKNTNDWAAFFKGILSSFIFTIIWAVIGSNFLFIQKYVKNGETYLGTLFPDDPNQVPYFDKQYTNVGGNKSNHNGGWSNDDTIKLVNKITGLNKFSFPYKWKLSPNTYFGQFKQWIANSIESSYVFGRSSLNWTADTTSLMSDTLTLILAIPLIAIFAMLTPLFGFFTNMYGQFTGLKGWFLIVIFAIGIITGLGLTFAGLVGSLQLIQLLATFLVLPLLLNSQEVLSIMGDHRLLISGMFGLLVVMGAFRHLKPLTGIVMSITYLLLVIKSYIDNKK